MLQSMGLQRVRHDIVTEHQRMPLGQGLREALKASSVRSVLELQLQHQSFQ